MEFSLTKSILNFNTYFNTISIYYGDLKIEDLKISPGLNILRQPATVYVTGVWLTRLFTFASQIKQMHIAEKEEANKPSEEILSKLYRSHYPFNPWGVLGGQRVEYPTATFSETTSATICFFVPELTPGST